MIRALRKIEIEKNFFNLMKTFHQKPTETIILTEETSVIFPLMLVYKDLG